MRRLKWAMMLGAVLLANAPASDLALVGAKIYVAPDVAPIEDGAVVAHDALIVAVGRRASIKIPAGARVVDCRGMVVTAGFWNSHVHILPPVLLRSREASPVELNRQLDEMFNRWGFTTVFDIASVLDRTLALRDRIERKEVRGPRILTTGEPVWTIEPEYVRDYLIANRIPMADTKTPEEGRALVRDHAAKGANGIKLFTGSAQAGGKVAVLPLDVARAAVTEAHRLGLPVFAHPQNLEGTEVAIESGVDILAHTVPQMPPWTPEFVARLKRAHMALTPTLTLFDSELRKDGASDEEREALVARMVAELRIYVANGGEVLFGTDIGYIDHYDTGLEFQLMAKAGMTFQQILASLTTNPARRFGKTAGGGRVAKGLAADLVVLGGDPAADLGALSKVRYTVRGGVITYEPK